MEDEAIGVKEVGKILKYSDSQIYKMVANGELKTLKLPGTRFSKKYIQSLLATGCAGYNPECARLERIISEQKERIKTLEDMLIGGANYLLAGVQKEVLKK